VREDDLTTRPIAQSGDGSDTRRGRRAAVAAADRADRAARPDRSAGTGARIGDRVAGRRPERASGSPAGRPFRSLAALAMISGLVATAALPAYGALAPTTGAPLDLDVHGLASGAGTGTQSYSVAADVTWTGASRSDYTATTVQELERIAADERAAEARSRAAAAAAAAAKAGSSSSAPTTSNAVPVMGSGVVRWPLEVPFRVGDRVGARGGAHKGTDMLAAGGSPIINSLDGVVTVSREDDTTGYGVMVTVQSVLDGRRVTIIYPHMQYGSRRVVAGETVAAGQVLGSVGSTGRSTANHLHYEVHIDGVVVDSLVWLETNAG